MDPWSIYQLAYLPTWLAAIPLSVYRSVCPSIRPSVCLSANKPCQLQFLNWFPGISRACLRLKTNKQGCTVSKSNWTMWQRATCGGEACRRGDWTADGGGATLVWQQVLCHKKSELKYWKYINMYKYVIWIHGNSRGSHPEIGDLFTLVAVPLCGFHKPTGI